LNTQFKKGVLELCALTTLIGGDKYGYELADLLGQKMDISEGSVYPMLKRLQSEGYFETYLRESPTGPARKYYRITISGKQRQAMLLKQWTEFTNQVNSFFEGV
jgi:PadR family transcriptional regulator PadR